MVLISPPFLVGGVAALLVAGVGALPRIAEGLIRRAVRSLPPDHRQRYEEEWLSELVALAHGTRAGVGYALRIAALAPTVGSVLRGAPPKTMLVKGAIDRCFGILLLTVVTPLMVCIAFSIRANSPGPVLTRQLRLGRDGELFRSLRFRCVTDRAADDRSPQLTAIGRFLRATALEELPLLLNVLAGSMSLVGPRAALPFEESLYSPADRRRLCVKPGMTCLWQLNPTASFADSIKTDCEYVDRQSLRLDAMILLKTAYPVRRRRP